MSQYVFCSGSFACKKHHPSQIPTKR
jgi:hypothetical protein